MSSRTLNQVMIIGNVVRKPELYQTKRGIPVSTFHLITEREWRKGNEIQSETEKHICVAWDRLAENCVQLLDKGSLVFVEGRLSTNVYKDKEGQERQQVEVIVTQMIRLAKPTKYPEESRDVQTDQSY